MTINSAANVIYSANQMGRVQFQQGPPCRCPGGQGLAAALRDDQSLALGLNTHAGQLTNGPVSTAVGIDSVDPAAALA